MEHIDIKIELPNVDLLSRALLRVEVDFAWSAFEFSQLFRGIEYLYDSKFWTHMAVKVANDFISDPNNKNLRYGNFEQTPLYRTVQVIKENLRDLETKKSMVGFLSVRHYIEIFVNQRLMVKAIKYASPGFTDFFGISGILKEVKEALIYYFPNQKDKEQVEIMKQEKLEMQINNLKAIGFTDVEIRSIFLKEDVYLERFADQILAGHIANVELIYKEPK